MSESQCPLCYTSLETIDVAPCFDCGHDPDELRQLAAGEHTYDEVELLGARAVLCDFCRADFSSYDPTYFGRPLGKPIGRHIQLVRALSDPQPGRDKYCPICQRRLAFLLFVQQARATGTA
jgi:hypothetical protein